MNSNRTLIILGIVVLLVIVGIGLYFVFTGAKSSTVAVGGATGTLPSAGSQTVSATSGLAANATGTSLAKSLGIISNKPVFSYMVTANNVVDLIQPDGEIDQVTNGNVAVLNSLQIQNIISAGFSYDGAKLFVNFGDPSNPQTSIFTIASKVWTPMPAGWQSPVWSPSDDRIAYITANANHIETFSTLVVAGTKTQPTTLLSLHAEDLSLAWPTKNQLIIETKPSASLEGSSWLFNLSLGTLTPITSEVVGLESVWNGGSMGTSTPLALQFSAGSIGGGSLQLVDASGNVMQTLKFISLPSKCGFAPAASPRSTPYLYCGVPRDQSDLAYATLPDAYNESALYTSDDIYQINLTDGTTNTLFNDASQNFDVSDPSFVNGTLFFMNRYNQELYGIQLSSSTVTN